MKLLFDENLSPKLVALLSDISPKAAMSEIWEWQAQPIL